MYPLPMGPCLEEVPTHTPGSGLEAKTWPWGDHLLLPKVLLRSKEAAQEGGGVKIFL